MSEEEKLEERQRLESAFIYQVVSNDGEQELSRPALSLWFSGLAAGIALPASVLAEALLHRSLPDEPWRPAVESFGYCFGFVLVVMGRLQLFTEQTITAVLPLFRNLTWLQLARTLRLWGLVLAANVVGTLFIAFATLHLGIVPPEVVEAMLHVSAKFAEMTATEAFALGIPAGFFIAAIVWMMPNSEGSEFWIVVAFTYLIAFGGFSHAIVGSFEAFLLMLSGDLGVFDGAALLILPTVMGNIIGGTGLFALLAYAQVYEEL